MEDCTIEIEDEFQTPRDYESAIPQTSHEPEVSDSDETTAQDYMHSGRIDIDSISIALDASPLTTLSRYSRDHKTARNLLSMQKEEAFQDWLAAKKFVYTRWNLNGTRAPHHSVLRQLKMIYIFFAIV